ncbi:hypothetical protein MPTK1_1g00570 [Marchantia polymorpha subsp. ruderalis]|uniref:NADH dehydrogenase [ubiquinone] 1 beta subcomplex subunit 2 n=2 Tax=Marchantia polymorpha TaxID=3197 RepID=A0AAF6AJZ9_MARPO|nr:hypothetical protein MARPO_0103s0030 [Marchantia polymorpha]BBM96769.1 hypothetical protein Mp_1g00570 [Marchantia polymorpha subsp. ruderalis]|eukprot:PTQ32059.1 hypothetical protein MARPO_0103s0030 [Marchantia polymorpha]
MAGGHGQKFADLTLHAPKAWQTRTGQGLCAVMWLWIMYRAKNDGAVLMGWRHPWDGHGHGHGHGAGHDGGHGHGSKSGH